MALENLEEIGNRSGAGSLMTPKIISMCITD